MYVMLWFLIPAHNLIMLNICIRFCKYISKDFSVIEQTQKNTKRHKYMRNVDRVKI